MFQAVVLFINSADDSEKVPKVAASQPNYQSFKFTQKEWSIIRQIQDILKVMLIF